MLATDQAGPARLRPGGWLAVRPHAKHALRALGPDQCGQGPRTQRSDGHRTGLRQAQLAGDQAGEQGVAEGRKG